MERVIPKRNYAILIGMIMLIICACFAFYNVYNIYQENSINTSPLSAKSVLYKDLKNATVDIGADSFLVISYTQDKNVYKNEKEIKKVLKKYDLIDNVMYLDITEGREEENFTEEINKRLKLTNTVYEIKEFPAVVYYKDNVVVTVRDSSGGLLNKNDFEQIIDMYDLAS